MRFSVAKDPTISTRTKTTCQSKVSDDFRKICIVLNADLLLLIFRHRFKRGVGKYFVPTEFSRIRFTKLYDRNIGKLLGRNAAASARFSFH